MSDADPRPGRPEPGDLPPDTREVPPPPVEEPPRPAGPVGPPPATPPVRRDPPGHRPEVEDPPVPGLARANRRAVIGARRGPVGVVAPAARGAAVSVVSIEVFPGFC